MYNALEIRYPVIQEYFGALTQCHHKTKKLKKQTELLFFNIFNIFSYADGYSPPLQVAQRYVIQVLEKKKGKTS
jgi:hypothetical protein